MRLHERNNQKNRANSIIMRYTKKEQIVQVPVSKGSGLKAEWGESPSEPVTVKLQLREISQIRACAWNGSDASSTVCFSPTEEYLSAGGIRRAELCGCRFRYPGKKIHVQCSTLRECENPRYSAFDSIIQAYIEKSIRFRALIHQFLTNFIA